MGEALFDRIRGLGWIEEELHATDSIFLGTMEWGRQSGVP